MSEYLDKYREIYNENYQSCEVTVNMYSDTDVFIDSYKGTFKGICNQINSFEQRGYFRFARLRQDTDRQNGVYRCFNTSVRTKGGMKFNIDELMNRYLNMAINDCLLGERKAGFINESYAFMKAFIERLLSNDAAGFRKVIDKLKAKYKKMEIVNDLDSYANRSGIYIMILNEYNTCYVGQSSDIKRRIKGHWSVDRGFDIKGIDTFKVGDTSKILFYECASYKMNDIEQRIIANIPMQYTLNWLKGGGMVIQEGAFFPYKSGGFEDTLLNDVIKAEEYLPDVVKLFCEDISCL